MRNPLFTDALRRSLLSLASLGLALAAHAQPAAANAAAAGPDTPGAATTGKPTVSNYRPLRASQLIGRSVRGSQGRDVGKIEDLVVDMRTNQLRYAMLSFDPGVLSAEQLVPIPTSRLEVVNDNLVYQATREELQRTAAARAAWDDSLFADSDRLAGIDRSWGAPTRQPKGEVLRRVSKLLGQNVQDRAQQPVGKVDELVVDMAGRRIHYAVVALEPGWAGTDKRVVLPLQALHAGQGRDALVLHADKARLQQMQSFSEERYGKLSEAATRRDVDRWLTQAAAGRTTDRASDTRAAGASGSAAAGSASTPIQGNR